MHGRHVTGDERVEDLLIVGDQRCHALDAYGRLGAHDRAAAAHEVVLERAALIAYPRYGQPTQHAVEDHREEVVHERRVPSSQQLALEVTIVRNQLVSAEERQVSAGIECRTKPIVKALDVTR